MTIALNNCSLRLLVAAITNINFVMAITSLIIFLSAVVSVCKYSKMLLFFSDTLLHCKDVKLCACRLDTSE